MAAETSHLVTVEHAEGYIVLTVEHPPVNAISLGVIEGLRSALEDTANDTGVRAVIITGSGPRFFGAGADVTEFQTAGPESIAEGQALTLVIQNLRVPVIAAVNGIALGGGCEIALACDIRLCSTAARFGQPEVNLGIIPGWGGTQRLPRLVGLARALPMLYTGEPIDAQQALDWGLVSEVAEPERLLDIARELAAKIATKAPLAIAATKTAIAQGVDRPVNKGMEIERREFIRVFSSADAREGVAAFLDKRAPVWTGR